MTNHRPTDAAALARTAHAGFSWLADAGVPNMRAEKPGVSNMRVSSTRVPTVKVAPDIVPEISSGTGDTMRHNDKRDTVDESRHTRQGDDGMTLMELLITMVITSIMLAITTAVVIQFSRVSNTAQAVADNAADLRQAVNVVGRQAAAASELNRPTNAGNTYYWEFLTTHVGPGESPFCTQWRLDPDEEVLERRQWDVGTNPGDFTAVSREVTSIQPFDVQEPNAVFRRPMVTVSLEVERDKTVDRPISAKESGTFVLPSSDGFADTPVCMDGGRP